MAAVTDIKKPRQKSGKNRSEKSAFCKLYGNSAQL
jgi:hypothetical protein